MQILRYLNKFTDLWASHQKKRSGLKNLSHAGFTIIETVLAIAILATFIGSIISLQASVSSVTLNSANRTKANWALRSAFSQAEYLIEVKGQGFFPEKSTFPWSAEKTYQLNVNRIDLDKLKPSDFVKTAFNVYYQSNPQESGANNVDQMMQLITTFLDTAAAPVASQNSSSASTQQGNKNTTSQNKSSSDARPANVSGFSNLEINVQWKDGSNDKEWSNTLLLMDQNMISKINIPNLSTDDKKAPNGNSP